MKSLSIILIIKNEEETLDRILKCLSFADEIIVVDTGSIDNSINIAKKYTDKIFSFTWINDFSAARNFAISKATKDYFMWLDADDVIKEEDQKKLEILKSNISDENIILLPYVIKHNEVYMSFYRERIIKNNGNYFIGKVHEVIPLKGKMKYVNIPIYHQKVKASEKERNLNIYRELLKKRNLDQREQYYYARELFDNGYYDAAEEAFKNFLSIESANGINKSEAYLKLASIYSFKDINKSNNYLFLSLKNGIHSSMQILNIIIYYFKNKEYSSCELFAKMLLYFKPNPLAFSYLEDKDFYAYLYLALCAYYQGNKVDALLYNQEALKIKPNDKTALKNQEYYK